MWHKAAGSQGVFIGVGSWCCGVLGPHWLPPVWLGHEWFSLGVENPAILACHTSSQLEQRQLSQCQFKATILITANDQVTCFGRELRTSHPKGLHPPANLGHSPGPLFLASHYTQRRVSFRCGIHCIFPAPPTWYRAVVPPPLCFGDFPCGPSRSCRSVQRYQPGSRPTSSILTTYISTPTQPRTRKAGTVRLAPVWPAQAERWNRTRTAKTTTLP